MSFRVSLRARGSLREWAGAPETLNKETQGGGTPPPPPTFPRLSSVIGRRPEPPPPSDWPARPSIGGGASDVRRCARVGIGGRKSSETKSPDRRKKFMLEFSKTPEGHMKVRGPRRGGPRVGVVKSGTIACKRCCSSKTRKERKKKEKETETETEEEEEEKKKDVVS